MDLRKELSDIKEILKNNPRGMTVTEISRAIKMNRHSVARYMDILVTAGHVEMRAFGSSKVFYPSRRLPMSAILNFSSDFILVLNKDQEIINVNDRFLEFEHVKKEDIINKSIIHSSFPMEFNPSILPNIKGALEGRDSSIEAALKNGKTTHDFTIKFIPTVFDDGEKGVTITFENITGRKNAENALKASEERFRAVFENAAVGIAYLAPDGHFLRLNRQFCDMLGYTHDELIKLTYMDLTHPDDRKASRDFVSRMVSGDMGSFSMEKRYIRKDGSVTWVNLTSSCIRRPDGRLEYTIAVIHDITGRKYAEDALDRAREELEVRVHERTAELKAANEALHMEIEKSRGMEKEVTRANRMMHEILEKAPFGIYVVNDKGYAEYVNPAMLKMPMGRHKDFKSKSSFDVPVHSDIGLAERIKAALNGEHFFLGPIECTMGPGKGPSTINFIGVPMEEGGARKVLIFVEDVSGQKKTEEKLQKNEALLRDIVDSLK